MTYEGAASRGDRPRCLRCGTRPIPGRRTRQVPERTAAGRTCHDVRRRSDGTTHSHAFAAPGRGSSHLHAGRPAVLAILARTLASCAPLPPPAPSTHALSVPEQFSGGVRNVPEHCSGGGLFGTVGNSREQRLFKAGSRLKKTDIEYVILTGSSFFSFQGGEIPTFAGHLARSHSVRFCKVFGCWASKI